MKVPKKRRLCLQKIRANQNTCVYKLETRVRLFSGLFMSFFSGFSFAAGTISEWINERRFAGNHQGRLQFICEPIFYGATIRLFSLLFCVLFFGRVFVPLCIGASWNCSFFCCVFFYFIRVATVVKMPNT